MSSSTDASSQQLEGLSLSCEGISDPQLQAALLRHPSISQDQQLVASLLQTIKELQAALGQWGEPQLTVQLRKLQSVGELAGRLQKHGHLLRGLEVDLSLQQGPPWALHLHSSCCCDSRVLSDITRTHWSAAAAAMLAAGMQQAAAAGLLQSQSFSLSGTPAAAAVLRQLSAKHLTHLKVEACCADSASMQAISCDHSSVRLAVLGSQQCGH
jgi:hypothetical protein